MIGDVIVMNRVAIITGASSGLGRAVALAFGSDGAKVVVNYNRSKENAERVAEKINGGEFALPPSL